MNDYKKIEKICENYGAEFLKNVPVAPYTSFKIGGNCNIVKINNAELLGELLLYCGNNGITRYVMGNGSNVLISDNGLSGLILLISGDFAKIRVDGDGEIINCQAGAKLYDICKTALAHSLTGLEFAYGIPGTAGGAVYMNAGAYGGEMKDVVVSASYIKGGAKLEADFNEFDFAYRDSIFRKRDYIITDVRFKLKKGEKPLISEKMEETMQKRREKQPLDFPSAGSTFKRPQGDFAARLIEACGLKGFSAGGAQVSEKHAGFIINKGGATFDDVIKLIEAVRERVFKETGITLETEVEILK